MRRSRVPLALLCLLLPAAALAQSSIKGTVIDQQTRSPLAGAVIVAEGTSAHATTDDHGHFSLSAEREFKRINVHLVGYATRVVDAPQNGGSITIELSPSNIILNEVRVVGGTASKVPLDNAASVSLLTPEDFHRNDNIFLQNSLNLVPGVMMNVRSASSQSNMLIRGIGTYSRFSIRGVKLYLNGIPLTDADGTTTLDDIDPTSIGRAEVIKGPASTLYGANLGGVVLLRTQQAQPGEMSLGQTFIAGSFGLLRTNTTFQSSTATASSYINYGHQEVQGFRDHSDSRKNFVTAASDFYLSDREVVSILANYSKINDNYAGELDSLTFYTHPEQAFQPYINKHIGLQEELTRLGLSHSYDFTSDFSNVTSLFTSDNSKVSPVEPRYSRSAQTKYGGRTIFTYNPTLGGIRTGFNVGAEFNSTYNLSKAYAISDSGVAGAITGDNEVNIYQTNVFAQAKAELIENTTLTVGASYNAVSYINLDMLKTNLTGRTDFDPTITPRIALTHTFDKISLFAQMSSGFTPPTSSQITLSGVSLPSYINSDLKPEKNIDYEIGSRGTLLDNRFAYDISLYMMNVTDALVQQTISGVTAYVNAGKSKYSGAELSASYLLLNEGSVSGIRFLKPWITYAYNSTKFDEYVVGGKDYSGNNITGTVPNLINAGVDFETDFGPYLYITYQYVDKMPLKDDNTLYTDAYSLLNAKIGYRTQLGDHIAGEILAGADNLSDTKYAATVALNASDKRYYAPAPGRNFYGGATIKYLF